MPIDPQGSFDWLLGTSREKYTLAEVARILHHRREAKSLQMQLTGLLTQQSQSR